MMVSKEIKDGRYDWTSPESMRAQWWESWIWKELQPHAMTGSGQAIRSTNVFYCLYSPSIQHPAWLPAQSWSLCYTRSYLVPPTFCFILNCYPPCLPSSKSNWTAWCFSKSTKLLPTSEFICLPCYLSGHHQATPNHFLTWLFLTTQISTQSVLT